MRIVLLTLLLVSFLFGSSQSKNSETKIDSVSFKANIELKDATKDGICLKGFIVNIPCKDLKKLDKKIIEVSGIVTIQKGLENTPAQYDNKGNKINSQGRNQDTKHILKPKYRIVKE
ncbi:MAG: hypothetical protein CMO82_08785 [Winogradskyella sp.]|uniref:Uncharacterized protein n=1 Tax=Winogradskyella poriferorum TaxID=307627 RepID=A0ABU7WAV4_9FLAO|nr:hypothetical protein [Winogradskyella sp.]|tara:strand:+ start:443 stop:793 length:351 start_codon:yes stop_codon:yes gene_type:complete